MVYITLKLFEHFTKYIEVADKIKGVETFQKTLTEVVCYSPSHSNIHKAQNKLNPYKN